MSNNNLTISNQICSGYSSIKGLSGILRAAASVNPFNNSNINTVNYIVSNNPVENATYTTINAACIAAAAASPLLPVGTIQTIYVTPGTYTENVIIPENVIITATEMHPPVTIIDGTVFYNEGVSGLINFLIKNINSSAVLLSCNQNNVKAVFSAVNVYFTTGVINISSSHPTTIAGNYTVFSSCVFQTSQITSQLQINADRCAFYSPLVLAPISSYNLATNARFTNCLFSFGITYNSAFTALNNILFTVTGTNFLLSVNTPCINVTNVSNGIIIMSGCTLGTPNANCISSSFPVAISGLGNTYSGNSYNTIFTSTQVIGGTITSLGNVIITYINSVAESVNAEVYNTVGYTNTNFWSRQNLSSAYPVRGNQILTQANGSFNNTATIGAYFDINYTIQVNPPSVYTQGIKYTISSFLVCEPNVTTSSPAFNPAYVISGISQSYITGTSTLGICSLSENIPAYIPAGYYVRILYLVSSNYVPGAQPGTGLVAPSTAISRISFKQFV